jgi:thymidylate kinase
MKFKNLFIVSIIGNIAAGKTTLLNALKTSKLAERAKGGQVVFIPEPHTIAGTKSHALATDYFNSHKPTDPTAQQKINLDFQLSVLADLHDLLSAANEKAKIPTLIVLERGWADVLVFAAVNLGRNSRDYITLKSQISVLFNAFADLTLYLPIHPNKALERAQNRAKEAAHEQQSVTKYGTLDFFKAIDAEYGILASLIPNHRIKTIEQEDLKIVDVISYVIAHAYHLAQDANPNDAQK